MNGYILPVNYREPLINDLPTTLRMIATAYAVNTYKLFGCKVTDELKEYVKNKPIDEPFPWDMTQEGHPFWKLIYDTTERLINDFGKN